MVQTKTECKCHTTIPPFEGVVVQECMPSVFLVFSGTEEENRADLDISMGGYVTGGCKISVAGQLLQENWLPNTPRPFPSTCCT